MIAPERQARDETLADLHVDVSDEVVPEVVANVHLRNFPELAELLVHLLEEIFELLSSGVGEEKTMWISTTGAWG